MLADRQKISYDYPFMAHQQRTSDLFFLHEQIATRYYKRQKNQKSNLFLVQDIRAHQEPIWVAKFSPCGFYLATGGKDGVLKVWQTHLVKSSAKERMNRKKKTSQRDSGRLSGDDISFGDKSDESSGSQRQTEEERESHIQKYYHLIESVPLRQYWEHEYDIVDLSWQTKRDERGKIVKSQVLATCSLDQKVIIWKIDKEGPDKIFDLKDAPTCLEFHPELETIFVTGSLDQTIRRWSIDSTDKCLEEIQTYEYITALAYQPNGKRLIVGLSTGTCNVY